MKRIYSYMFAAVAIVAAASCQKEINEPINNGGDFTVTASIGADTKTVLEDGADGNKIYWTPGDKIAVYNAEGQEVTFITDITEKSTTATFTNDSEFTVPSSLVAVSPKRTDRGATSFADGIVTGLHIGGTQNAVAGSYDPLFAVAIGTPKSEGSNELIFNNVHSLIKFTIGGTIAPKTIRLKNNGQRAIAGMYDYNIVEKTSTMTGGNPYIDLTGTFEVGQTYYIATTAGLCGGGISLIFDGETVKNTGENITLEHNKIYNLGTVQLPEETEETEKPVESAIDVNRVWGYYGATAAWSNTIVSSLDNNDRSLAMDDKYIYIPETNTSANIHKFSIADGSYLGTLPKSADMNLGTHYVSCARTVQNAEGKYILLVSNLSLGSKEGLRIFAYINGTDAEPVTVTTIPSNRRWGDKFTITGTWENGKMWFRSYDDRGMGGYVPLQGKAPIMKNETEPWNWVEAHAVDNGSAFDADNISEITFVPGTEGFALLNTNSDVGAHVMSGNKDGAYTEVKTYPELAKTFGYNFFDFAGEKFVAWTSIAKGKNKPRLQIVQSDATTLDNMVATFDNLATRLVFEAPLQSADNFEADANGGGNTVCDCCVREINGEVYIAAIAQKAGFSVFKVTAK